MSVPFQEYYLVLALGLKGEQSLWLGAANAPVAALEGMYIHFVLTKTSACGSPGPADASDRQGKAEVPRQGEPRPLPISELGMPRGSCGRPM